MFKEKITKMVSTAAAVACAFTAFGSLPAEKIKDAEAADKMTALEITENMKIGWNLGNTLDATASKGDTVLEHAGVETETAWGCPKATQELFDAVKAKGFNTVRVPTTWFQHLNDDGKIDEAWMARVREVVDYGIKNDMYIILNLHHENWVNREDLGTAYDEMKPKLVNLWTQIAAEFKDYDQHLIFEGMNEPRAAGTDHEWWGPQQNEVDTINKLNADFVNTVRGIGGNNEDRLLMVPGYCAGSDVSIISLIDVPNDPYVAVSIHAYVPYNFTMNSDEKGYHDTFTATFRSELKGILDGIRSTFTNKDIPVVIGEMGTSNFNNTEARCEWAEAYITTAKAYGIPCVLWDNNTITNKNDPGECHGYINRSTYEWYEVSVPVVDTMIKTVNDSSIVWGSERHLPVLKHADLSEGDEFLKGPVEIDAAKSDTYENTTPGKDITWAELEGKEVAIKFTGDTPILAFSDTSYGNWTELQAYAVDEENGIAYYLMSSLPDKWGKDVSEVAHMQAKTNGVTVVESITILPEPEGEIEVPEPTAKIYKISLADADREGTLVINFKGEAGISTNGSVGFMNGEKWDQVEWSGKLDADGNLTVEIAMSDIPASVENAEIQIWDNFDLLDMISWEVKSAADTDIVYGDANCDGFVTVADAVAILQSIGNRDKYELTPQGKLNADVDGVAGVTASDALVIQQVDAGIYSESELPLKSA